MFVLRGIAVWLSLAILVYFFLSVAVILAWRSLWRMAGSYSSRQCADWLLALRFAPLIIALAITLAFAVPSFLLLEPRYANEALGAPAVILSICALGFVSGGIWKAILALARTSRAVAGWEGASSSSQSGVRTSSTAPPLTAAGIFKFSIWLSREAESALTPTELQTALQHERIHLERRDNLRKLLLRLIAFPGMEALENAWRDATETAADDAAVANAEEAIELAAAIVKLSRLTSAQAPVELTTALISSEAEFVGLRVSRLLTWDQQRARVKRALSPYAWCAMAALIIPLIASYGSVLIAVHAASEWLVR